MAKLYINPGIDTFIADLNKLKDESEEICKRSAYEGARIVADSIRAEIESIPVESEKEKRQKGYSTGLTRAQKAGLLKRGHNEGLGIARFRRDGDFINVKIGMSGYNTIRTKKYPNGQPNALIIRALESGTPFRARNPVITRGTNAARGAAEAAIQKQMDEEIKKRIH